MDEQQLDLVVTARSAASHSVVTLEVGVLSGAVDHRDGVLSPDERVTGTLMQVRLPRRRTPLGSRPLMSCARAVVHIDLTEVIALDPRALASLNRAWQSLVSTGASVTVMAPAALDARAYFVRAAIRGDLAWAPRGITPLHEGAALKLGRGDYGNHDPSYRRVVP